MKNQQAKTERAPLTKQEGFASAATPLIEYLKNNCHPHMSVLVTADHAELLEGQMIHRLDYV